MAKARAMQAAQERPIGLLETDLDEAVINAAAAAAAGAGGKKTRSLLDLNHTSAAAPRPQPEHALHVPQSPVGATHRSPRDDVASAATSAIHQRPHKSMEFLLDKENLHFVKYLDVRFGWLAMRIGWKIVREKSRSATVNCDDEDCSELQRGTSRLRRDWDEATLGARCCEINHENRRVSFIELTTFPRGMVTVYGTLPRRDKHCDTTKREANVFGERNSEGGKRRGGIPRQVDNPYAHSSGVDRQEEREQARQSVASTKRTTPKKKKRRRRRRRSSVLAHDASLKGDSHPRIVERNAGLRASHLTMTAHELVNSAACRILVEFATRSCDEELVASTLAQPPENELQKVGERVPSEHELRVQRSLQRLNVPDWYKNSPAARDGFRLKRHSDASQHGGWRALGSKTTSLSSLSSSSNRQPTTGVLLSPSPTPPVFSRWSTSLLNSAGSSPASSARSSFNHRQPYLGWRSQERLTNPRTPAERLAQGILPQLQAANKQQQQQQQQQQTTNQQLEVRNSIKEVTSAIVHYVQSGQEVGGGGRLSPRSRPEDWDDRGGARSTSPRGSVKLCWMESSFVGTRPVDSPETPMSLTTDQEAGDCCNAAGTESCSCQDSAASGLYLDLTPSRDDVRHQHHQTSSAGPSPSSASDTDEAMATAALLRNKPSPGSTTLEDVLDSLLGLPPASRTPSPGPGGPVVTATSAIRHRHTSAAVGQAKAGKSCSDLRQDLQESARSVMDVHQAAVEEQRNFYSNELVRRKSEGSDTSASAASSTSLIPRTTTRHRRVSFDNAQDSTTNGSSAMDKVVRCRNNKCGNSTTLAEARRAYKSCHNCTCLYCSRECRRAHWQRHRRTCLHSRAGSLCRQVLSSAKEDPVTLKHISTLARRGYAAQGRGAVKCFFSSPEAAERFVGNGFADLGEPTYVRWSDLLPGEMGAELYAELMRLCKTYNPEARLVLYVAVCVVSEVPTSGAVRWERQLVSRCAKIRLEGAATRQHAASSSASPQARRQQAPASPCNITREMDSPETLVLTSLPGNNGQNTPRRAREISFTNIQRQLRLRGVSLRRHFPQVYRKLCSYVDGSVDKFAPVTIYPRDQASGKSFMCIIMLDAEPERLQLLPTDSSRVRTVDISVEQE
ncbi:hypothetical protein X777_14821 [Ooceraea biroi]|uniref:MYND-type domain-containing protein n=1 Tax=Ooceraea biroi TaxID=2015173 RepID=A0A026WRL5_OOCBI|nr:hypothetical protein X777_14821 [Ooceraea biroi]